MADPDNAIVKAHCNKCLGHTNQKVVHVENSGWTDVIDDDVGISIGGGDHWTLLRCLGCDSVRLKHENWFSEDCDERGRPNVSSEWFPPSVHRQKPAWRHDLRLMFKRSLHSFDSLSDEIYEALAIGAHRLATMGIRALVERIMIEQVGDLGTFDRTIAAFLDAGHVAPNQQSMFKETLIEAGHAAMHRGFEPSADTVNTLLDIVEGIMHAIYYAPLLAAEINQAIPKRK